MNAKKKRPATKVLTPRSATTEAKLIKLPRDNWNFGDFWMLVTEAGVHIAEQKSGEYPTQKLAIPRRVFNHFIDKYNGVKRGAK